jgi:hypothetical protein
LTLITHDLHGICAQRVLNHRPTEIYGIHGRIRTNESSPTITRELRHQSTHLKFKVTNQPSQEPKGSRTKPGNLYRPKMHAPSVKIQETGTEQATKRRSSSGPHLAPGGGRREGGSGGGGCEGVRHARSRIGAERWWLVGVLSHSGGEEGR